MLTVLTEEGSPSISSIKARQYMYKQNKPVHWENDQLCNYKKIYEYIDKCKKNKVQ